MNKSTTSRNFIIFNPRLSLVKYEYLQLVEILLFLITRPIFTNNVYLQLVKILLFLINKTEDYLFSSTTSRNFIIFNPMIKST